MSQDSSPIWDFEESSKEEVPTKAEGINKVLEACGAAAVESH